MPFVFCVASSWRAVRQTLAGHRAWCPYRPEHSASPLFISPYSMHSFVKHGPIKFHQRFGSMLHYHQEFSCWLMIFFVSGSINSLRGRNPMSRDMPPRAHIAYVAPNRHVRKQTPSNVSSFKQPTVGLPHSCHGPQPAPPNPYANYPPKRGIHFGPIKNQPQPPPYNSDSLKRDSLQPQGSKDCGCQGNCNHRRTIPPDMWSQPCRDRTSANTKDPRGCEMKPVNAWPSNTMKLDKVSYLDSVVWWHSGVCTRYGINVIIQYRSKWMRSYELSGIVAITQLEVRVQSRKTNGNWKLSFVISLMYCFF